MSVRETSIAAYQDIKQHEWPKALRYRVLDRLFFEPSTIRELADYFKTTPNVISPRIDELRKEGLIHEHCKRPCRFSQRMSIEWSVGEQELQMNLF